MEEDDEQRKIDLRQHALEPVSKRYLVRIIMYVVLLTFLGFFMYYMYNRESAPKKIQNPEGIKEIKGVTLSDSL